MSSAGKTTHYRNQTFEEYKRKVIKTAKDLLYKQHILEALQEAETEGDLIRIMMQGRKEM